MFKCDNREVDDVNDRKLESLNLHFKIYFCWFSAHLRLKLPIEIPKLWHFDWTFERFMLLYGLWKDDIRINGIEAYSTSI